MLIKPNANAPDGPMPKSRCQDRLARVSLVPPSGGLTQVNRLFGGVGCPCRNMMYGPTRVADPAQPANTADSQVPSDDCGRGDDKRSLLKAEPVQQA